MPQIAGIVKSVFEAMPHEERADHVLDVVSHKPLSIHLKKRGQKEGFRCLDNATGLNDDLAADRAVSKGRLSRLLSCQSNFSDLVNLPKTRAYSHPFEFVPYAACMPVPLEGIIADVEATFSYPVFVKPDDASVGENACSAYNRDALILALNAIYQTGRSAVVQEKIEIEREYRCVYFNQRAYLLFDRMFAERGIVNGRVTEVTAHTADTPVRHVDDDELWGVTAQASDIISNCVGLKYFAADFARDTLKRLWFIEANVSPRLGNVFTGCGTGQMEDMARDMIDYVLAQ